MYIKRTIEDLAGKTGKRFKAVLVTGARQVGKSTLQQEVVLFLTRILIKEGGGGHIDLGVINPVQ